MVIIKWLTLHQVVRIRIRSYLMAFDLENLDIDDAVDELTANHIEGENQEPVGTPIAEYVQTPILRECGTCIFVHEGNLCDHKQVVKDPEMKKKEEDGQTFAIISLKDGCCKFWNPGKDKNIEAAEEENV